MQTALQQLPSRIRLEWGLDGAAAIGRTDVAIVVDVLSFSTCVSVAAHAGITVLPYRWAGDGASAYAAKHQAVLAVGRSAAVHGQISLSPGSIRAAEGVTRLVLPSPNGSTIAAHLRGQGTNVLAGSLRNAEALSEWLTDLHGPDGATVAVIAAGERWPCGTLRPAVEDLWGGRGRGAGAATSRLDKRVTGSRHSGWRLQRRPIGLDRTTHGLRQWCRAAGDGLWRRHHHRRRAQQEPLRPAARRGWLRRRGTLAPIVTGQRRARPAA